MASRAPRLIHAMALAQHRLKKSTDAAFKDGLGISTAQLGVLFFLEKHQGAMFKEVSNELGVNASAVTALVDRMEAAGLVRRRRSDVDERAFDLFATDEGLARAAAARPILARLNARLVADFSAQEIVVVARFLDAILERF